MNDSKPGKDARFTIPLHLRLTPQEMERIQQEADRIGCTLSAAARSLMKKNSDPVVPLKLTEGEATRRKVLAAKAVRNDFKQIAADYHDVTGIIMQSVAKTDDISTAGLLYSLDALRKATADLQDSVNAYLADMGVKEIHKVSRPSGMTDNNDESDITLYNMEEITVMGMVNGPVRTYINSKNVECMQFTVTVQGPKDRRTDYVVQQEKTGVATYLTDGRQVVVSGQLAIDFANRECRVYAYTIKLCSKA